MSLLERNLDALGAWTPATAEMVRAAQIPADFQRRNGTDGTPTYSRIVKSSPPRIEWLGATSMPAASAAPIVESLNAGAGNGLGLSIGSGFEWAAFAAKLAGAQAVFVYEPDPALLRMALDTCDLSPLLASGKILLFTGPGPDASDHLSAFLKKNAGYEVPGVLHPLPTLAGEKRNPLLAIGEGMVRRAIIERQGLINALVARLEETLGKPAQGRVALTLTPRYPAERPIRRALSGLPEIRIDHHTTTSLAPRLELLIAHRPAVVLSDLFRPQLGCIPPAVAVQTWVPPVVGPAYWDRVPREDLSTSDRIIVHSAYHQARLVDLGIPVNQIELRPSQPDPMHLLPEHSLALRHRVALVGDLSDIDPQTLKIELPTHLAVFAAARDIITDEWLSVHPALAPDILRRALARAHVASGPDGPSDPALREPMLRIVRDVLIPTLPLHIAVEKIASEKIALRLVGDWPSFTPTDATAIEPFPPFQQNDDASATLWSDVALLVHLSPTGTISPVLWQAVAAGVAIVSPQHPADAAAGSLAALMKPNAEFAHPSAAQWLATLRSLLRDADRRSKFAAAARARFTASPTPV
ncbi:MAG: hypothetical protein ACTHN5_12675 [Phycisphaerae bacterium]